jgi:hypothetical protein
MVQYSHDTFLAEGVTAGSGNRVQNESIADLAVKLGT